jgi:hypothetical protein
MFSTTTRAEGTIPEIFNKKYLDPRKVVALNFGVGGYSSSSELPTFLEVARRERVSYAIFYDGVNEVARYAEYLQDEPTSPFFDVVGYYLSGPYNLALLASVSKLGYFQYRLSSPRLWEHIQAFLTVRGVIDAPKSGLRDINQLISQDNVASHARKIVELYVANVLDVTALARRYGVETIFFWQPDVYLTKKHLTPAERELASRNPGVRILSEQVRVLLREESQLRKVHFVDLSSALDDLDDQEHFFDYCHLSEEGNERIAERMKAALVEIVPIQVWRDQKS